MISHSSGLTVYRLSVNSHEPLSGYKSNSRKSGHRAVHLSALSNRCVNMAPRGLTRLVLILSAAVAAPPGAVDGTQPDPILDDHFEERPELLPVDDDEGPFRIVTGNPTSMPCAERRRHSRKMSLACAGTARPTGRPPSSSTSRCRASPAKKREKTTTSPRTAPPAGRASTPAPASRATSRSRSSAARRTGRAAPASPQTSRARGRKSASTRAPASNARRAPKKDACRRTGRVAPANRRTSRAPERSTAAASSAAARRRARRVDAIIHHHKFWYPSLRTRRPTPWHATTKTRFVNPEIYKYNFVYIY